MKLSVNETFVSIQGEGHRAGTTNVFVRLAGCNLACSSRVEGFDCDTDFSGGRWMDLEELHHVIAELTRPSGEHSKAAPCRWVILTGGEPMLQVTQELVDSLHDWGYHVALETNGTLGLKEVTGIDYVACSPKGAAHAVRLATADELRYVLHAKQALPKPACKAEHLFLSPAWEPWGLPKENLSWCIEMVKRNPEWRLSVQQHKTWGVR